MTLTCISSSSQMYERNLDHNVWYLRFRDFFDYKVEGNTVYFGNTKAKVLFIVHGKCFD